MVAIASNFGIILIVLSPQTVTDPVEWNQALQQLPNAHVLQSWEWGAFKAKYGWTPTRILWCEGSRPCAAAQILRRRLPRTPFGVLYVPKGPVLDYADAELFGSTLDALEQAARSMRAIFVKIDPDIVITDTQEPPERLGFRAWRESREQIQFKNTALLDVTASEADLVAGMKPKTRYNIRLAEKRGVRVVPGTRQDLELFYAMYAETSARDGFLIRPLGYYRDAWGSFLDAGLARMLLARVGDETVAGLILFVFGKRAWYFYGSSRNSHRELMPNYLLQWHAILQAKASGCTLYDFWGAPDVLDETAPMYGVYRFKEGFGAKFTRTIGAYDFVVNPLLYYLYAVVRPRYLARLRGKRAQSIET